ncbi:hypothetical protein ACLB2K_025119 [Fragaria x ananassa]
MGQMRHSCQDLAWSMNPIDKSVMHCKSARAVWLELQERFMQSNTVQLFNIENEIHGCEQGTDSVTTFFTKLKALWDERDALCDLSPCAYEECGKLSKALHHVQHDQKNTWILDSGASDHIICTPHLLTTKYPVQNRSVKLPYGSFARDLRSGKIIGTGSEKEGLYCLDKAKQGTCHMVSNHPADLFTKPLSSLQFETLLNKSGVINIHSNLRGYARVHRPLDSVRVFDKMEDFQCKPTEKSYITIFGILVEENQLKNSSSMDAALRIFREMPDHGCTPDSYTYGTLINGLYKLGKIGEAKELFHEMGTKIVCRLLLRTLARYVVCANLTIWMKLWNCLKK